jgi:hypothetical protein
MATRSRTSFQKRQKEIARAEKQRDKAAKRLQKKLGGGQNGESDGSEMGETDDLNPLDRQMEGADGEPAGEHAGEHPGEHPGERAAEGAPSSAPAVQGRE